MSDTSAFFNDPYAAPGRGQQGRLTDVTPRGYQIEMGPDGRATAVPPNYQNPRPYSHFDNLADELLDEAELGDLCNDLLEAIEEDKDSRSKRDEQYEEGLNRTGMGSNIIGGADFPGASRAVHPLLLESSLDFCGAMMNELLPPGGPCKIHIEGDESDAKDDRGKRVARWINYQFTDVFPASYHEFEIGFTQCPLGGGFYTKTYLENGKPAIAFIPIDHVYRPYSDGDFYTQPRITHAQSVDKWTFRTNVDAGLWRDVVNFDSKGGNLPPQTKTDRANNRVIGRDEPTRNIDAIREVYEASVMLKLADDDVVSPYLVTIDVEARQVLSVYRNWREDDEGTRERCIFLIEWPFWPWRGGYPVGLTHMIGSLAGAATGSLRALLDAAMLNTTQTGVRLKGGATAGGQNMTPRVTEITEVQGSLAQDDIRKTYMPVKFNEPSGVLLNLLGFLVDAGRGVVRSTYDDMEKFGAQTPVGTTQMFLEQGLRNLGAVHGRMHRAMKLVLKGIYQINQDTLTNATVMDTMGELTVTQQDFQGPMNVTPVSDPRLFSDLQRKALAQTVVSRVQAVNLPGAPPLYNARASETYFLRQMGADNPDQFLVPNPQPQRTNAVSENVAISMGAPIKAFPGQDHEAHINNHMGYLRSPFFGANASLGPKIIPPMIEHLGEHLALWYNDAMLEAATEALRQQTGDPNITLQSFMGQGTEVGLDRLMAELDDEVLEEAKTHLKEVPAVIEEARQLLKRLQPPQPMDPSMVAQDDVQRQREKDQGDLKLKADDLSIKGKQVETAAQTAAAKIAADKEKAERADALKASELEAQQEKDARAADQAAEDAEREHTVDLADISSHNKRNDDDNETAIEITQMKNESAEKTAKLAAASAAKRSAGIKRPRGGRGNLSTGTGMRGGDKEK